MLHVNVAVCVKFQVLLKKHKRKGAQLFELKRVMFSITLTSSF